MIKLNHVNKFYNKGKSNELHVLNDIDISLPEKGFITFFGPSGSGKTTLLNVIGGLDRAKGTIDYEDVSLSNYPMGKTDAFRRESVGYIFQNYQLLTELSVYDNLKTALEVIGITDKEECDRRIAYCLRKVGLYSFRKKPAGALSGGQMQRVSIARALVKNCRIIIADEPTGNLDSENGIEIMKILKRISKNALVLLVTHNASLAEYYSDTIMEVHDGKIIAVRTGNKSSSLDESHLNKIYLGNLVKGETHTSLADIETYSETDKKLTLQIIEHNGQYFLRSSSKIRLLEESPFTAVDGKKEESSSGDDADSEFDYDTSFYNDTKRHHASTFFRDLKKSFFAFFQRGKKGSRFFKIAFVLLGVIMGFVDMTAIRAFYVTDSIVSADNTFVLTSGDAEEYNYSDSEKAFLKSAVENNLVDCLVNSYASDIYLYVQTTTYEKVALSADGYYLDTSLIDETKIIDGRKPEKLNEFVASRGIVEALRKSSGKDYTYESLYSFAFRSGEYDNDALKLVGIYDSDDCSIYLSFASEGIYVDYASTWEGLTAGYAPYEDYTIVYGEDVSSPGDYLINEAYLKNYWYGNVDYSSAEFAEELETCLPASFKNYQTSSDDKLTFRGIYTTKSGYTDFLVNDKNYVNNKDKYGLNVFPQSELASYRIVEGRDIEKPFEMLVSPYSNYALGEIVEGCTVVGTYFIEDTSDIVPEGSSYHGETRALVSLSTYGYIHQNYVYGMRMNLHASDASLLMQAAKQQGITLTPLYDSLTKQAKQSSRDSRTVYAVVFSFMLAMVAIYIYFTMRSKMIKDIYTIGVERSLGFSRGRIILRQVADILVTTAFTSFLGYLVTIGVIEASEIALAKNLAFTGVYILVPWLTYFLGGMLILMSLLFGLLPILLLLRKTPAEITSKYDI